MDTPATDTTHPHVDPLFRQVLDEKLKDFQSSLHEVREIMRGVQKEHPDIRPGQMIRVQGENDVVRFLTPEQVAARGELLDVMRDVVCDAMEQCTTREERIRKMAEIVQGGLHGSMFFAHDYDAWHMVDAWLEASKAEFFRRANPKQMREYRPAFDAASDYGEMCEMADATLTQLLHAHQRSLGHAEKDLYVSCYDLALEQYYEHYPSRRGKPFNAQEDHWVTSQSQAVLATLLQPYAEGLPEGIVPEMAACVALVVDKHANAARTHTERLQAPPHANDNNYFENPQIQEQANATLARVFKKHPDAARNAGEMLAAWRELEKEVGKERGQTNIRA